MSSKIGVTERVSPEASLLGEANASAQMNFALVAPGMK
jgi:hypothetical protein